MTTSNNKIFKGLMVLEEFTKIPLEGFYNIDPTMINLLNRRFRQDGSQDFIKNYIQSYGFGIIYLNEFLLKITKTNLPYKDGFLVLKTLQKFDDPVLNDLINRIIHNTLDEGNTFVVFDKNLNDLENIVGEQGHNALDKSIMTEDVNAYLKFLNKSDTIRTSIKNVYDKIFNLDSVAINGGSFLNEVQSKLGDLMAKNVTLKQVYEEYIANKNPSAEVLYFDSIINGINETFVASNLNEYYENFEDFTKDHSCNNFITLAEKKWAINNIAGNDSFKTQCVNNIFDEIVCTEFNELKTKKVYRTKDETMISNYIEAIDSAIEQGFIPDDEWGLSFMKETMQQCFAMI